mgnify:FL=1|tara:strand:- start:1247 stop:1876 length:630 start_codon:yes stop_codon:yes gene_type:complete
MEKQKPLLRGTFHQAMFFIAVGACPLLIIKSNNASEYVATAIYSSAVMMMFGFSALYHKFDWKKLTKRIMRKLDHIGIFIMIAGTATPFALLITPWPDGLILLVLIWCVALLGALQIIYLPNINTLFNVVVYVSMSIVIFPYLLKMFNVFTVANSVLMILGIILYIIGAASFGFQYPKLSPKIFGYHEVWHSFVSVAAILHFIVIYSII